MSLRTTNYKPAVSLRGAGEVSLVPSRGEDTEIKQVRHERGQTCVERGIRTCKEKEGGNSGNSQRKERKHVEVVLYEGGRGINEPRKEGMTHKRETLCIWATKVGVPSIHSDKRVS